MHDSTKYVTSNSVHEVALAPAVITGLSFPVVADHFYTFQVFLAHIGDAGTTGARFMISGVAARYTIVGSVSVVTNSATNATLSTGVITAVDTAIIAQTTGAAANGPTWIAGTIQPSASGNFELWAAPEVDAVAGVTVLKGSWMRLKEAA